MKIKVVALDGEKVSFVKASGRYFFNKTVTVNCTKRTHSDEKIKKPFFPLRDKTVYFIVMTKIFPKKSLTVIMVLVYYVINTPIQ